MMQQATICPFPRKDTKRRETMEGSKRLGLDRCNSKLQDLVPAMEALRPSDCKDMKIMSALSRTSPPILCNTEASASSKDSTDEWSSSSSSSSSICDDASETGGESDHPSVNDSEHERATDGAGSATKRGHRKIPQQPSSIGRTEGKKARKSSGTCRKSVPGRNWFASAHGEEEDSDVDESEQSETLINDLQETVARLVGNVESIQDENLEMMNQLLALAASNIQLLASAGGTTSTSNVRPSVAANSGAPGESPTPDVPSQSSTDGPNVDSIDLPRHDCLDLLKVAENDERRSNDANTPLRAHPEILELIAQYTKSDHAGRCEP